MRHPLQAVLPALLAFIATGAAAGEARRWEAMDYGPTLGCSLRIGSGYVLRALVVTVDAERQVRLAYDLETMRLAAAWKGGFIDWRGVVFNGEHHEQPKPAGSMLMVNAIGPGWAHAGSFADPRPLVRAAYNVAPGGVHETREGQPLPKAWVAWRGSYLHRQRVVLAYTVDGCAILELPGAGADGAVFTRTFTVGASPREQRVQLAPAALPCALAGTAAGVTLVEEGGERIAVIAPAAAARTFMVAIGDGPLPALDVAPSTLIAGGPARWPATLTTQVARGADDGAYAVDTLTAPDDNPWRSWLRFAGIDFSADGRRAALCTWSGDVWLVDGIGADSGTLTWKRFATGLHQPLGLRLVGGKVHLTCREGLVRLHDLDGDDEADFYENFNSDIHLTRHFHEFALDLQTDAAGNFYYAKGATPGRGGPDFDLWSIHNGALVKVSPDGATLDVVARGLRAPNGIGIGPRGELVSGDNQGSWVPVCPINRIRPGGFVGIPDGVPGADKPTRRDPPIAWIPYDIDNSSGGQVWVPEGRWGPLAGTMLHLSYGKCSLFAVHTQQVGDDLQGALARLPLTFASGIMRARFNPADGQLYVCGMRGWQTSAARDGIVQRVRWTGKPANVTTGFTVSRTGVAITFSDPLDPATAEDAGNYASERFNVLWSAKYGTPELSLANPGKHGRDQVAITAATLQPDRRTVVLTIPDLRPVHCMLIKLRIQAADGTPISTTLSNTIHSIP